MRLDGSVGVLALLTIALAPGAGAAQVADDSQVETRNAVSANPFLLIAEWYNAEWEHRVSATSTVGGRFSRIGFGGDNARYFSGRGFWRYYPKSAFEGFFFGLDGGVTGYSDEGEDTTFLGAGFELGYGWLLGAEKNFYVSLGAGADRLFAGDLGGASAVIPTVRLINVGIAF